MLINHLNYYNYYIRLLKYNIIIIILWETEKKIRLIKEM
mgnify:CR=1 FL=1